MAEEIEEPRSQEVDEGHELEAIKSPTRHSHPISRQPSYPSIKSGLPSTTDTTKGSESIQLKKKASVISLASTSRLPSTTHGSDIGDEDDDGIKPVPSWRFTTLSLALGVGLFMSFMDGSITSTALYTIGTEFDNMTKVTWIALAYTLADVGLAVVFTAFANIVGRFNAYLVAQAIFAAFSIGAGFATSLDQLIAFRCLQGIGGSGLYTVSLVIWQEVSTVQRRKYIGGGIGLCIALGGVMGPILGGIITSQTQWRWIFWINPPIIAVSTVLFVVAFPHGGGRIAPRNLGAARKFDAIGCLLLIAGCVLPCFALMHAAEKPGLWAHGIFIGPIVAGVCSWILLVLWGLQISKRPKDVDPTFPPHLFKNRRYAATTANSLFVGVGFVIAIYNVPLRLQTVNGKSPIGAGISLLPLLCLSAVGSFCGTAFSPKKDNLGPTMMLGSAIMCLGLGLMSTLSDSASVQHEVYGFQVLVGLGFGMTASSSSIMANIETRAKDHAVGQGIVAAARVFGGSVGLAGATAMLAERVQQNLAGIVPPSAIHNLASVVDQLTPAQMALVRHTYSEAYNHTFLLAAMTGVVAFLASLFSWNSSKEDFLDRLQHKGDSVKKDESSG